jgi:hypothetical protein
MVPDVAESMTCRQLPDQFHLRSGDESGDQSEHAIESLHRTALDAQRDCAEAEQDARRVDVRAGAQHPPGCGIGDDENGFAHHRVMAGGQTGSPGLGVRAMRAPIAAPTMWQMSDTKTRPTRSPSRCANAMPNSAKCPVIALVNTSPRRDIRSRRWRQP